MKNIKEFLCVTRNNSELEKNPDAIGMCELALHVVRDAATETSTGIDPGVYAIKYFEHFSEDLLHSRLQDIVDGLQFGHFNKRDRETLEDFRDSIEIILEK